MDADQSSVVIKVELVTFTTRTLNIPLSDVILENLHSDLEVNFSGETVKVTVEGEKDAVNALTEGDISLTLDFGNMKKGGSFQLTPTVNKIEGINKISASKIKGTLVEKNSQTDEENETE